MKQATREWARKAEGDRDAAVALAADQDEHADQICFFAQQAAEKYIKSVLVERSIVFPKSHDLTALADLIAPPLTPLLAIRADLDELSRMAVQVRYPGFDADRSKSQHALAIMKQVENICRESMD